jgi:hypothetical protein
MESANNDARKWPILSFDVSRDDFELKFNSHISNICKKASRQLNDKCVKKAR